MLSIVIPTFNEKGNIKPLLKQIAEALKDISYEIIFVDDSNDETPNIILFPISFICYCLYNRRFTI